MVTARLTGLIFLALFLIYGYLAQDIQLDFWASAELFDARTFPTMIAIAGAFTSALLVIFPTYAPLPKLKGKLLRPILLIILMLLYSFALEPLGFITSTLLFLICGFGLLSVGATPPAPDDDQLQVKRHILNQRLFIAPFVAVSVSVFFYLLMSWLGIHLELGVLEFLSD